jgi:hypothetical protein
MLREFARQSCGSVSKAVFLQDQAPQHVNTRAALPGASFVAHPAQSPDCNPMEHCFIALCDVLQGMVLPLNVPESSCETGSLARAEGHEAGHRHTVQALQLAMQLAWREVDANVIRGSIVQLPSVMRQVHECPEELCCQTPSQS